MKAFAPGKLVLTGAYAVLHGAPAIVIATSRGAVADSARSLPTPTPEVRAAIGDAPAPHVDASAMFLGARKLGIGASAAILVASLAAIDGAAGKELRASDVRAALFDRARAAHAEAQSGGSGVDVAASIHGGVLEYVAGRASRRALPTGTVFRVYACGTSAHTKELRTYVDRLAEASPLVHRARLDELSSIAHDAARAVERDDREAFVGAMQRAARSLARLGEAASAPIVPEGFETLEAIAASDRAAFCVSGAGGGDVAVYLGASPPSAAFVERARALGLFGIDVDLDEKGVRPASEPAATSVAFGSSSSTS